MGSHKNLFSFLVLLLSGQTGIQAKADQINEFHPTKLFVFGDSYVDTGNTKAIEPYGITFPGKPAGRWSDGRVLTDYIAKYLGLKSPVPYRLREQMTHNLKYGMNFAFGGTGVFDTNSSSPNMTIQIDFFEQVIKDKVYNASDLNNSVAYVSVAGNDYMHYLVTNFSIPGLLPFVNSVVDQATTNLIRIQKLGVKKIVVGGLQPLGCLPIITALSPFKQCSIIVNNLVVLHHNDLLKQSVTKLDQESKDNTTFLILDLYDSFSSVLKHPSTYNIQNPLKPCCVGVSSEYYCGSVDKNGVKKYKVCDKPKSAFFWDVLHPTQAGWHAVYNKLQTMGVFHHLFH